MTPSDGRTRVGLFGIGLDTYWKQFPGLRERLEGYLGRIGQRISGAEVVAAGLVDRRPDPDDRRAILHEVTPRGKARAEQRRKEVAAVLDRALVGFLPAESHRLVELLTKLNQELDGGGLLTRPAPGLLATS